jgi:hypothetical protein
MPSNFFIVVSIYWKPASYRSSLELSTIGKTTNWLATKVDLFFFSFGPTGMLFDLSIALRLRHDSLRSLRLELALGLVRHGYP